MTKLSPLALEIRKQYHRQYRVRQKQTPVTNPTSDRDLRYWEKKASDLLKRLQESGHADQAEILKNCPSATEFAIQLKILTDSDMSKT